MRVDVAEASERLLAGEVVGLPTETVYGLGASLLRRDALKRVFALKARPEDHPLIVHVAGAGHVGDIARPDPRLRALADLWPGPLTVVLPNRTAPSEVTGGHPTVAVRVPDHPLCLAVLRRVGAVAAPSANRFGGVSPTQVEHVEAEFPGLAVLDGGPCGVGVESTIVALIGTPQILRPGAVSLETLITRLGPVEVGGQIAAPGTLPSHYAPRARVVLVAPGAPADIPSLPPGAYARVLYARLRALDATGMPEIRCALAEPVGIGVAINDRLRRAANRG